MTELDTKQADIAQRKLQARGDLTHWDLQLKRSQRLYEYRKVSFGEIHESHVACDRERGRLASRLVPESELASLEQFVTEEGFQHHSLARIESLARGALGATREQLDAIRRQRTDSLRQVTLANQLRQQIVALGLQYSKDVAHAQSCPLCGTAMDMEELKRNLTHLSASFDSNNEVEGLVAAESVAKTRVARLDTVLQTLARIGSLSPGETSLEATDFIRRSREQHTHLSHLNTLMQQTRSLLSVLSSGGFEVSEYGSLLEHAKQLDPLNAEDHTDSVAMEVFIGQLEKRTAQLRDTLVAYEREEAVLETQLQMLANKYEVHSHAPAALRSVIREALQQAQRTLHAYESLPQNVRDTLGQECAVIRAKVLDALQSAETLNGQVQRERARSEEIKVVLNEIAQLDVHLGAQRGELQRLQRALDVLTELRTKHSLDSGLDEFFSRNTDFIEQVFSKVHSPKELQLADLSQCKLRRIDSKQTLDLNQISTGQRAAFVLSVFLTLNLSLRSGPPLILIDDPIAHIDDLNALSLDLIGDIGQLGTRQVFFATANEKLANLFEKKMVFLGEEFRVHRL